MTYSGARDVTQRVNEEWPDEDRIQGCESEVDEEESNHCSREALGEKLRRRVQRDGGYDAGDSEGCVEVSHIGRSIFL